MIMAARRSEALANARNGTKVINIKLSAGLSGHGPNKRRQTGEITSGISRAIATYYCVNALCIASARKRRLPRASAESRILKCTRIRDISVAFPGNVRFSFLSHNPRPFLTSNVITVVFGNRRVCPRRVASSSFSLASYTYIYILSLKDVICGTIKLREFPVNDVSMLTLLSYRRS